MAGEMEEADLHDTKKNNIWEWVRHIGQQRKQDFKMPPKCQRHSQREI